MTWGGGVPGLKFRKFYAVIMLPNLLACQKCGEKVPKILQCSHTLFQFKEVIVSVRDVWDRLDPAVPASPGYATDQNLRLRAFSPFGIYQH